MNNAYMYIYHILNGDAMRQEFEQTNIGGQVVVFREGFIDGDLSGETLHELWKSRSAYMGITDQEYHSAFVSEIDKIINAPDDSEFNLWFEYDLFCQVNFWFLLSLIESLKIRKKVYAVYSTHLSRDHRNFWNGFGPSQSNDLISCFDNRIMLTDHDLKFGKSLWLTYQKNDLKTLREIGGYNLSSFPYLKEVIAAHIDRYSIDGEKSRVENVVTEIIKSGSTKFEEVFSEFWKRESIYGFGDIQFKSIYERVVQHL